MREVQSVMVGKSQQRMLKAAGHTMSLFKKQREMDACFFLFQSRTPVHGMELPI